MKVFEFKIQDETSGEVLTFYSKSILCSDFVGKFS